MAAGLGFKTFTTGEVLTAADTNGYLMQGILVFASEAARDAAITSPQEGQFAFTKDNNTTWFYDGATWVVSGATGDIEGVTAGVGISGGGTSGTVTITNSMATTIDAAGDIIYGTGNDAFTKLSIGTVGQVLQVNSGATAPEWATAAASGGKVLQVVQGTKTDTTSTTSQTFVTTNLSVSITPSSTNSKILVWVMGSFGLDPSSSNVYASLYRDSTAIIQGDTASNRPRITTMNYVGNSNFGGGASIVYLDSPASTSALTYALYFRSSEGGTVYLNRTAGDNDATTYSPRSASTIVAMEIGA
jgi:hypothetical protein